MCEKWTGELNTRRLPASAIAVTLALSLGQSSAADGLEFARQGQTHYATYYTSRSFGKLDLGEGNAGELLEASGITRNTDGQALFDNLSAHCLVFYRVLAGKPGGDGACTEVDHDGDKIFSVFDAGNKIHTVIGGTGKYAGISGTASFSLKNLPEPAQGLGAFVVEHAITWQFK